MNLSTATSMLESNHIFRLDSKSQQGILSTSDISH